MLNKSIYMNFKIVENEFVAFLILPLIALFFAAFSYGPGIFIYGIIAIIIVILNFVIYVKLFRSSLFGDGAEAYMSIPMSPRDIVLGKVILVTILAILSTILTIVGFIFVLLIIDSPETKNLIAKELFGNFITLGASSLEDGIMGGLYLAAIAVTTFVEALVILFVQLLFYQYGGKKRNSAAPTMLIILTFIALGGLNYGIEFVMKVLNSMGINYLVMYSVEGIIVILAGIMLYRLCVRKFTYEYDLA